MSKEIFENEEEFNEFLENGMPQGIYKIVSYDDMLKTAKPYIKRNPVEEAEYLLKDWLDGSQSDTLENIFKKALEAIQYLKKQLKEK